MALFYKLRNFISDKWWNFRKRCQRFKRGYAWGDVWDMDVWFIDTATPMLEHLLKNHRGHPCKISNEKWEDVLKEMIACLKLLDENEARALLRMTEDADSAESSVKVNELMEEKKNRFFELFSEWFFNLWD